jgi:hypothetical protein
VPPIPILTGGFESASECFDLRGEEIALQGDCVPISSPL